jgi:transcriptional regulator with XRE-family HTH domain
MEFKPHPMVPETCRAARAYLNWPQSQLAKMATVNINTVKKFERHLTTPIINNLYAMQRALENSGILFVENEKGSIGILWRPKSPPPRPERP